MSNLIPEQRTDKNGVTSTRWVRPADAANKTTTLPVPALPLPPEINYREGMEIMLSEKAWEYKDDHTKFYATASEHILSYIYECLVLDEDPDSTLRGQLSCLMNDNAEERVIEAWLHLRDMHEEYSMDDMGEVDYIRGALDSGTNPLSTYDRNNPEHAKTVRTLYQFLYEGDSEQHGTRIDIRGVTSNGIPASSHQITNPHLADYLINNPEQIDTLVNVGNDHPEWLQESTFDSSTEIPDILREYIDTTAPLQQGVL
jgi:hypothetical protein